MPGPLESDSRARGLADARPNPIRHRLPSMQYLYAHQHTWVWILKKLPSHVERSYDDRGWTFFEQSVSSWIKDRSKYIDLGLLNIAPTSVRDFYQEVERTCASHRGQPLTPSRFRDEIMLRAFTNKADHQLVAQLYERCFDEVLSEVHELDFRSLGWTDVDMLLEVLQTAKPPFLRRLLLNGNPIDDPSVPTRLREALGENHQDVQLGIDRIEERIQEDP